MLRETVITFEVLSYCRKQDRGYVCDEKSGGAVCEGSMCGGSISGGESPGDDECVKSGADIIEAENDDGG